MDKQQAIRRWISLTRYALNRLEKALDVPDQPTTRTLMLTHDAYVPAGLPCCSEDDPPGRDAA